MKFTEARLVQAITELPGEAGNEHVINELRQSDPGLSNDNYC